MKNVTEKRTQLSSHRATSAYTATVPWLRQSQTAPTAVVESNSASEKCTELKITFLLSEYWFEG